MDSLLMRRHDLADLPELPALPDGLVFREYRETDREPLAAILRSAFADESWTPETVRERLIDAHDVHKTFVVASNDNDSPVATASVRIMPDRFPDSGYVHWVAVDPAYQGKKLGYYVTLACLHDFAARGLHDAVLETDDHRLPAIKTYQNLGFKPEHRDALHIDRWAKVAADLLAAVNL